IAVFVAHRTYTHSHAQPTRDEAVRRRGGDAANIAVAASSTCQFQLAQWKAQRQDCAPAEQTATQRGTGTFADGSFQPQACSQPVRDSDSVPRQEQRTSVLETSEREILPAK